MARKGWKKKEAIKIHLKLIRQRIETLNYNVTEAEYAINPEGDYDDDVKNLDITIGNLIHEIIQLDRQITDELPELREAWEDARE